MSESEQRLREVFLAALELSGEARSHYLSEACRQAPGLLRRVEILMTAHEDSTGILNTGADLESPTLGEELSEGTGTTIGRYKILQVIGEGGMGVVYMAEQIEPVVRKVALKIIKLGMDTKQVVARFEAERQALALMDHPNIARVLDAGATETGRPYFVMELVKGVSITDYSDKNRLSTKQRLELFMPVCQAIQHAHQKGIIHRDIKPSNVMVTLHDGKPVPKVIDFGIAKAINQRLTEKTLFTNYAQMIGTPAYMSPEQAEMSGLDVDTRTDVYSLGVLLYELLTGTTPFSSKELLSLGYGEMQKVITGREPPKPSTRLSAMENKELTVVAGKRSVDGDGLSRQFKGDLDWIVMKVLEKDRTRRYETVNGLVADVERHLNDEPVSAAAPTFQYQLQKFYRRNKGYMRAAGVVAGLLVLGAAIATILAVHSNNLRQAADLAKSEAEAAKNEAVTAQSEAVALLEQREKDIYFGNIKQAQYEVGANRLAHALEVLERCLKKYRNWEWRFLYRRCLVGPTDPLVFHSPVISFSFDESRNRLAALCEDGSIPVRDLTTGDQTLLSAPRWSPDQVAPVKNWYAAQWIAVRPSVDQLAVIAGTNKVMLIDSDSGAEIRSFSGHSDRINAIAFNAEGTQMATSSLDKTVRIWSCEDGSMQFVLQHDSWTTGLVFTPDGHRLITGRFANGEAVRVWDTQSGREVDSFSDDGQSVFGVAVSPDGLRIASSGSNNTIFIRDSERNDPVRMEGNYKGVSRISFSSDSSRLISGGDDRTLRIWETATGREILNLHQLPRDVMNLAFVPFGDKVIGGSHTRELTVLDGSQWEGDAPQPVTLTEHQSPVLAVAFHPSESKIVSGSRDGVILLSGANGDERARYQIGGAVFDLSFDLGGTHILSAGLTENDLATVDVWSPSLPSIRQTIVTGDREFWGARFSPDGRHAVIGGVRNVQVWEWRSQSLIGTIESSHKNFWKLTFSPNGDYFATAHTDGVVLLWDTDPLVGSQEGRIIHQEGSTFFRPSFSHDSALLAVGDFEGNVTLLNTESGNEEFTFPSHGAFVSCVAFSPDGRILATGSADRTVRLWDASTREALKTFFGHEALINCLAFSSDSSRLASSSADQTVKIWAVPQ